MSDNDVERPWWVFEMPDAVACVPADTEDAARFVLLRNHAPELAAKVMGYPLVCTRFTSRSALVRTLLGRPYFAGPTVIDKAGAP